MNPVTVARKLSARQRRHAAEPERRKPSGTVYRSASAPVADVARQLGGSAADTSDRAVRREHGGRTWTEWVRIVVAPVAVAVAVAAVTPLGDGLREVLFPTRVPVTGTVTLDGKPVAGAGLELDGERAGSTDAAGVFLFDAVDDGAHRLRVLAVGAYPGTTRFVVHRDSTEVKVEPVVLRPLVVLGFAMVSRVTRPSRAPSRSSRAVLDYEFALWIDGLDDVLRRVRDVAYVLPAPLPEEPVRGVPPEQAFCYRQTGKLSFPPIVKPALDSASATVHLDDGQTFSVVGRVGVLRPPDCRATEAPRMAVPPPDAAEPEPRATWPSGDPPTPNDPSTPAPSSDNPVIERFWFARRPNCAGQMGGAASAELAFEVRNAHRYAIRHGGGGIATGGPIDGGSSVTIGVPCDGGRHTYTLTVEGEGGSDEASVSVGTAGPVVPGPGQSLPDTGVLEAPDRGP